MSARRVGAYLFFIAVAAGSGVAMGFIAADVGFAPGLLGLLSVPLGLAVGYIAFSPRVQEKRVPKRSGLGVVAVASGAVVADQGGHRGGLIFGLILLGFVFGLFLYVLLMAAPRSRESAAA
ncbi:MAG TPA: hypothetical protein VJV76_06805 [Gaiellaceae bacterium]|nr:hypothetical protein [Gaiellaceae bacterium]